MRRHTFAAAALAFCMAVLACSTPARADVYFPPGMPSSDPSVISGPGGSTGPATVRCVYDDEYGYGLATGNGVAGEGTVVILPYTVRDDFSDSETRAPVCGGRTWRGAQYCPTGFDVWRFYGTVPRAGRGGNPVLAMSVSRVNFDQWCRPQETTQPALFSPHPNDAGVSQALPFQAVVAENPRGEFYARTERNGAGKRMFTTAPITGVYARTGFGTCTDAIPQDDLMARVWEGRDPAAFTAARTGLLRNAWVWGSSGLGGRTVDAMSNMKYDTDPTATDPGTFAAGWDDNLPCGSGYEFTADENSETVPVFGTCALPTQRRASIWQDRWGDSWYGFETLAAAGGQRWFIEGYHDDTADAYPTFPNAAFDPRLSVQDNVRGAVWYQQAWRKALHDEILRRAEIGFPGEDVPGAPYPESIWDKRYSMNFETSADVASKYAVCGIGAYQADVITAITDPAATLTIGLDTPEVFEAGGKQNPQYVSITTGDFTCSGCQRAGAPEPYLYQVRARMAVSGTNGYTRFKVASLPAPDWSLDTGPRRAELWFYAATRSTSPSPQRVQVTLTDLEAFARVFIKPPERRTLTLPDGTPVLDAAGNAVTYTYYPPDEIPVEIKPGVTNLALPVVAGTADPSR